MTEPIIYKHAIVKFNGGRGALLCNRCRKILATGFTHEDKYHFCEPACKLEEDKQNTQQEPS